MDDLSDESVLRVLRERFGHPALRPGQGEVIRKVLDGRRVLAVLPTGGGKSLCYQIPALMLEGTTIVVSPLLALMRDQVGALARRGISAARWDSTQSPEEAAEVLQALRGGDLKLLYVSPEKFVSGDFLRDLRGVCVSLLAVDEAHCVSEWGHSFRPEYLRLAGAARRLKIPRLLGLTATVTPNAAGDVRREFRIRREDQVQTSFFRPNLSLHVRAVADPDRLDVLAGELGVDGRLPAIVYVTLQATAEDVAASLQKRGFRARAYHAGFADDVRVAVQEDFLSGACDVVVATIAFGMGVDKADVRSVFHYNLPRSLEGYQQEIGRAGRDGQVSHCELLACAEDLTVLENFVLGETPDEASLRHLVGHLLRQGEDFEISRHELSQSSDLRYGVVDAVIVHLEREKLLGRTESFHGVLRVRFAQRVERLIAGHKPAVRRLLLAMTEGMEDYWQSLTVRLDVLSERMGLGREKILSLLETLEEGRELEMDRRSLRQGFRLLPAASARRPSEVAEELVAVFAERERRGLERIAEVVGLIGCSGCLTRRLLRHFGERLESDCGACGRCAPGGGGRGVRLRRKPARITMDHMAAIDRVRREGHAALRSGRALARFLCGIRSPATTRDRLVRHEAFGLLAGVPFAEILVLVDPRR